MLQGKVLDRRTGIESESEARAHDAGESGDADALAQIEFLDGGFLLLLRHFALLGHAGQPGDYDPQQADKNSAQYHQPGVRSQNLAGELAVSDRRRSSVPNAAHQPNTMAMPSDMPR